MILSIRIVNEHMVTSILLSDCSRGRPIRIWELGEKKPLSLLLDIYTLQFRVGLLVYHLDI